MIHRVLMVCLIVSLFPPLATFPHVSVVPTYNALEMIIFKSNWRPYFSMNLPVFCVKWLMGTTGSESGLVLRESPVACGQTLGYSVYLVGKSVGPYRNMKGAQYCTFRLMFSVGIGSQKHHRSPELPALQQLVHLPLPCPPFFFLVQSLARRSSSATYSGLDKLWLGMNESGRSLA